MLSSHFVGLKILHHRACGGIELELLLSQDGAVQLQTWISQNADSSYIPKHEIIYIDRKLIDSLTLTMVFNYCDLNC